ncbi:dihydroneopterin aldolase [Burkholderia multivorans]|uniref:dihydroneopterin aldolase n=1 Tax=Burkholderia multivorans TaxID=87883 RepID=UPI000278081B|nr:dihydroneopterin aldolase [Burkholderia multivorans]EJO54168.1 putative dihydroneopterin aldolase [Burkholderia multivorans CF2]MBJ9657245.1 dihydroneopterin aldolase [Burkholderia multivorans]MBR8046463.1 dihydroneopterin aldolase [Burkholderia multivorans]MBR8122557.1 dihydroneopterin aldolase [Burkholderia multivorans]MBR8338511.1 dihydroneopterin aldolase [Burkholderia multivorans]
MNATEAVPTIEWEVVIDQFRAQTRVGIYGHERASQPVVIDALLRCRSLALPEHIDDCLDYDAFCRMLCTYLDKQVHTDLVERLAAGLLALAFERFAMLEEAVLTLFKPHAVRSAERVGVRLRWCRRDYLDWRDHLTGSGRDEAPAYVGHIQPTESP